MKIFDSSNNVSAGFSRILKHLDGGYAIVSAYLDSKDEDKDAVERRNKEAHQELKEDVSKRNLGYIELNSTWREKGVNSDEISLFIPKADYQTAIDLGVKYNQHSVLQKNKDENCVWYCTDKTKCGGVGKVIKKFRDKGFNSREDFLGVFFKLKKGSRGARNMRVQLSSKVSVITYNSLMPVKDFQRYSYLEI